MVSFDRERHERGAGVEREVTLGWDRLKLSASPVHAIFTPPTFFAS